MLPAVTSTGDGHHLIERRGADAQGVAAWRQDDPSAVLAARRPAAYPGRQGPLVRRSHSSSPARIWRPCRKARPSCQPRAGLQGSRQSTDTGSARHPAAAGRPSARLSQAALKQLQQAPATALVRRMCVASSSRSPHSFAGRWAAMGLAQLTWQSNGLPQGHQHPNHRARCGHDHGIERHGRHQWSGMALTCHSTMHAASAVSRHRAGGQQPSGNVTASCKNPQGKATGKATAPDVLPRPPSLAIRRTPIIRSSELQGARATRPPIQWPVPSPGSTLPRGLRADASVILSESGGP